MAKNKRSSKKRSTKRPATRKSHAAPGPAAVDLPLPELAPVESSIKIAPAPEVTPSPSPREIDDEEHATLRQEPAGRFEWIYADEVARRVGAPVEAVNRWVAQKLVFVIEVNDRAGIVWPMRTADLINDFIPPADDLITGRIQGTGGQDA